jgi:hypothetical protein
MSSCADTPKEKKTTSPAAEQTARRSHWSVISLAPFADSINHARYQFPNSIPPWPLLSPDRPDLIADNLVAWQNPDGGWPKNVDFQRAFPAGELEKFIVSVAANEVIVIVIVKSIVLQFIQTIEEPPIPSFTRACIVLELDADRKTAREKHSPFSMVLHPNC